MIFEPKDDNPYKDFWYNLAICVGIAAAIATGCIISILLGGDPNPVH